jgi:cyclase
MLAKRIIPCLDVKNNDVVKGVQFRQHQIMGDIIDYASYYQDSGADELVFYDILASSQGNVTNYRWIEKIAAIINIPFCVAGGIRTIQDAKMILNSGADKISINSPALENPELVTTLSKEFGSQCVVVGIDSYQLNNDYLVYQYTGDPSKMCCTRRKMLDWAREVERLGAGEIVLNCMNCDGVKRGYDITQLQLLRKNVNIPVIASGGAGCMEDFYRVFNQANVDGALAASVFHNKQIIIHDLKAYLKQCQIVVRY